MLIHLPFQFHIHIIIFLFLLITFINILKFKQAATFVRRHVQMYFSVFPVKFHIIVLMWD